MISVRGALAQLVARNVRNVEVRSSNLLCSTTWVAISVATPFLSRKEHLMSKFPFCKQFFHISGPLLDLDLIETDDGDEKIIPFYYWNIILKSTGKNIGCISLRIGHNYHSYYNGNVGYEIEEPFRGHHYAYYACRMLEPVARYHSMDHLIYSCDFDNTASYKTMERLGARLLETVDMPKDYVFYYDGIAPHRIYRLDLSPALSFITLRERPELKDAAASWFHSKWGVPESAYLKGLAVRV